MKPNFLKHVWIFISILAIMALACYGGGAPAVEPVTQTPSESPNSQQDSLSSANRAKLISATVQILGLFNQN